MPQLHPGCGGVRRPRGVRSRGWYSHREYVYDRMGVLVEVKDAAGEC
jgi:hypothetical protein